MSLLTFHDTANTYEIGVDECARGPLFGRVYTSACVLPKDGLFRHDSGNLRFPEPFPFYTTMKGRVRETVGFLTYTFIAAASILAKNAHDEYILKLCEENPYLKERYSLHENMGYGTAKHIAGIKAFGTTEWHRKSFKVTPLNDLKRHEVPFSNL